MENKLLEFFFFGSLEEESGRMEIWGFISKGVVNMTMQWCL